MYIPKVLPKSIHVTVGMVLAGNFERKLQAIISDAPYKHYGLSEIMAYNFYSKLPYIYILFWDNNNKIKNNKMKSIIGKEASHKALLISWI